MSENPHPSPPSADDDNGNGGDTSKRRKNRPGRSSRRRKHKARSILMEATGETITTNNDVIKDSLKESVVPTDRSYTLEGVKVRRKEEWLKRRKYMHNLINNNDVSSSLFDQDEQQTQHIHDESSSLDPIDECQLKAQLGYVPGNAICVAARTSLEESFNISDASEIDDNLQASSSPSPPSPSSTPPSVLKLYPMAVRETYRGGTTDGRKFKGRRRGVERSSTKGNDEKTDDSNNQSTTNTDSKKAKKERCWFIESPSDGQAAVATTIDTVTQHDDDDKEAPEAPKHIIEPFPTIYWLTSPKLRTYISKMELSKDNNVQTIERRLRSSSEYLNQMERAHKSYGRTRWQLLTSQDRERVIERGWENALDERRGVAGISLTKGRFDCVKCLHAHAAHYLAQVAEWEEEMEMGNISDNNAEDEECNRDDLNLVGKWTMEAVEKLLLENAC